MKTQFPYADRIDYGKYLDAYLLRDDAYRSIPTDTELTELARKSIVREQLVLVPLPEGTKAETGDTAVLKTESNIPKFNKERVTVTLGRGLYSKELEPLLIGKAVGEAVETALNGEPVKATVLELKRKQAPEPTDEMVAALEQKDMEGNPIATVAEYEKYIRAAKVDSVLANINYFTMESIMNNYPIEQYDEDDIKTLGALEKETFIRLFREHDGIDLTKQVPKSWEEDMNVHSVDEFIAMRRDWYKIKIQQCLIYLNLLGLRPEGRTDPCDHYEVLSELMEKMFAYIRSEMERRNTK